MASTDKTVDPEAVKGSEEQQPPPPPPPPRSARAFNLFIIDVTLRALLFAASVISLVVMVTANETKTVAPGVEVKAKFDHSPAFIYFAAALSVSALYSLLTGLASFSVISHPSFATKFLLHFAFWDVLVLGIVASATGSAGGVAYIGLKGNSHVRWNKICNNFDKFCQHLGSSIAVSLVACVLLLWLSMLSTYSLHSRIPK